MRSARPCVKKFANFALNAGVRNYIVMRKRGLFPLQELSNDKMGIPVLNRGKVRQRNFRFCAAAGNLWKIHYINGKQQQNWADVTLFNYLGKMGEQGWEVASMTSHMSVRSGTLPIEHLYIILKKSQES